MKTTIKYAIRHLVRDPFHSLLHIFGFSLGIACVIIILLYLQNELSYDSHNLKADRIYRIASSFESPTSTVKFAVSSPSLGPKLAADFPEIESYTRMNTQMPEMLLRYNKIEYYEEDLVWGEESLFDLFDYTFIYGSPENSLKDRNSIVLSESLAKKYFGEANPIGEIIEFENQYQLQVTAVYKDLPFTVHVPVAGILSYELYSDFIDPMSWPLFEINDLTYVLFPKGYSLERFWEKFPDFYKKYATEDSKSYNQEYKPIFTKLSDLHYNTEELRGEYPTANKSYHIMFGSIGVFILLLSCINYINMSTARATERAKEVHVKKICGSPYSHLFGQFLLESFLLVGISIMLGVIIVEFILSFTSFNDITGLHLTINLWDNTVLFAGLTIILLGITLLSGFFPAIYTINADMSGTLSSRGKSSITGKSVRDILVVVQFSISIIVINLMLLMNKQVNYIANLDLGFSKTGIVSIDVRDTIVSNRMIEIKAELREYSDIVSVSSATTIPGSYATGLYKVERNDDFRDINYHVYFVQYGYLETIGLELVQGRDFDIENSSDITSAVLVNEELVKDMGWEDPIGKQINQGSNFRSTVVGVVKNFHFQSIHQTIKPLIVRMTGTNKGNLLVRFNKDRTSEVMGFLSKKWTTLNPARPFIYEFLDDKLDDLYRTDRAQIKLIHIFSYISVFISCLGLLGLTSYTALRKTKEVGIRKVLGASVIEIVFIMFKSIMILISIAFLLASFASSFFLNQWLDNFAYKTNVPFWIYLLTGIVALVLAWITVSYHFMKVARKNPVDALRYE